MIGTFRSAAKRALERTTVVSGLPRLARALRRGDVAILAYHNVLEDGAAAGGDRSLHLPFATFRAHLDLLERTHAVVPLDEALRPPGPTRRPRAVITFDDAYRGAVALGVPELVRRGLPFTIFVAPGILGAEGMWWDQLADPSNGAVPFDVRDAALHELTGTQARVDVHADSAGWARAELAEPYGIASAEEVEALAGTPGLTFGAHSWSHSNLAALDRPSLGEELERPREWLRDRLGVADPWLAYPYGMTTPAVDREAAAAGYRGSLRVTGGPVPPGADPAAGSLPRVNIPSNLTLEGFELRVAGLQLRGRKAPPGSRPA